MNLHNLLDPLLDASFKGFPHLSPALHRSQIGAQGWNVLQGDLPLPLAVIKRSELVHNLAWMQDFAQMHGLSLAPHGKTSMSPQLFQRQIEAGAWGMTFANVTQMRVGLAAGVQRCLIANQVFADTDLQCIAELQQCHATVRVLFLVDSQAQLALIEAWYRRQSGLTPFEVLLEIGVPGGRTGCRDKAQALLLAQGLHASPALRMVGLACYEGLGASGDCARDRAYVQPLMERLRHILQACDAESLFETDEVLISAGGSAVFDLVTEVLKTPLRRPARGVLRSGCYVTHDQGVYKRMMRAVSARTGCGAGLEAALEVWARVQSCPEPGLVILAVGKRDLSYDWEMPVVLRYAAGAGGGLQSAPADWQIVALNDQHAHLRGGDAQHAALQVGDLVCLGISHPCTTFDKWRWMPLVDEHYTVCDAIVTCF